MRILRKLNSPVGVLVMLALFLTINGFLLYRYQQSLQYAGSSEDTPPIEQTTRSSQEKESTKAGQTIPSRTPAPQATKEDSQMEDSQMQMALIVRDVSVDLDVHVDGELVLAQKKVPPGFHRRFSADREITFVTDDGGAVHVSSLVNGQHDQYLGTLGGQEEAVTRTFTPESLRE